MPLDGRARLPSRRRTSRPSTSAPFAGASRARRRSSLRLRRRAGRSWIATGTSPRSSAIAANAAEEIDGGAFDLFLAHSSAFLAVAPIARFVRAPRVLYLHEPQRVLYEAMPTWPWIPPRLAAAGWARPRLLIGHLALRVRLRWFAALAREEATNVAAYDRVLANSLFSRESMLRAYGVNARACYLGVDTGALPGPRRAARGLPHRRRLVHALQRTSSSWSRAVARVRDAAAAARLDRQRRSP